MYVQYLLSTPGNMSACHQFFTITPKISLRNDQSIHGHDGNRDLLRSNPSERSGLTECVFVTS